MTVPPPRVPRPPARPPPPGVADNVVATTLAHGDGRLAGLFVREQPSPLGTGHGKMMNGTR